MNARALAAWSAAAVTMALSTNNPAYRAVVVLCALNVIVARRRREARARPLLIAALVATAVSTLITVLLSHTGTHVLIELPEWLPVAGGRLTTESLAYGVATGLGIAAALLAVAPLTLVTEPHELVDALPSWLARTGAAIGTALNLMPAMARSASEIRDAQRMRGWRGRRVREWPDVAVPVVLTAIESSLTLAEAMEARGYGTGARTHLAPASWSLRDAVIALVACASGVAFIVMRMAGVAADWYPFPTLTPPAVSALALVPAIALILPALVSAP